MIIPALLNILKADPSFNNMCGERVYPFLVPQKVALPAVTYLVISDLPAQSMAGPDDLSEANVEIKVWAKSYKEAHQASRTIRGVLDNNSGSYGGITIQAITLTNNTDDTETDPETSVKRYAIGSEFQIWYEDN